MLSITSRLFAYSLLVEHLISFIHLSGHKPEEASVRRRFVRSWISQMCYVVLYRWPPEWSYCNFAALVLSDREPQAGVPWVSEGSRGSRRWDRHSVSGYVSSPHVVLRQHQPARVPTAGHARRGCHSCSRQAGTLNRKQKKTFTILYNAQLRHQLHPAIYKYIYIYTAIPSSGVVVVANDPLNVSGTPHFPSDTSNLIHITVVICRRNESSHPELERTLWREEEKSVEKK